MTDAIHPARPASIILLLRDGDDGAGGLEVMCLQRSAQLGAFSGVLSFPGGKVSDPDCAADLRARSDGAEALDDQAFGHAIAAIREAFEEAGILLARRAGEADPIGDAWATSHVAEREALARGEM
ncbi:MAG: NUDIX domain-containing protein, partial [Bauldia litoralis]